MAPAFFRRDTTAQAATDGDSATPDPGEGAPAISSEPTPEQAMAELIALSQEAKARRAKLEAEEAEYARG